MTLPAILNVLNVQIVTEIPFIAAEHLLSMFIAVQSILWKLQFVNNIFTSYSV